jgi:hypothetical protein
MGDYEDDDPPSRHLQFALEDALRDARLANENLTRVQARCSELLGETRAQRMAAETLTDPTEWKTAFEKALAALRGKK